MNDKSRESSAREAIAAILRRGRPPPASPHVSAPRHRCTYLAMTPYVECVRRDTMRSFVATARWLSGVAECSAAELVDALEPLANNPHPMGEFVLADSAFVGIDDGDVDGGGV